MQARLHSFATPALRGQLPRFGRSRHGSRRRNEAFHHWTVLDEALAAEIGQELTDLPLDRAGVAVELRLDAIGDLGRGAPDSISRMTAVAVGLRVKTFSERVSNRTPPNFSALNFTYLASFIRKY